MSRRYAHQSRYLAPDLRTWVQSTAEQYGLSQEHIINSFCEAYGENGVAIAKMKTEEMWEIMNEWRRNNYFGTSFTSITKPSPGERVIVAALSDNDDSINIRIWLGNSGVFCFDFIDDQGRYMRTPPEVEIYSDWPGTRSRVLSLEDSFPNPRASRIPGYDAQWEIYLVAGGSKLHITRPGHEDFHITIPSQRLRRGRYFAAPEYW
ncbi:hypothetical protein BD779DRAFT_1524167 [Infundibulicybe gibba]|nr:hypothetical protein BD779DRAFT_1579210 [Infundibulicybe gibba]KAF8888656.1 hypothetical protein BD779DRAFT_1524167 [Infundibulicybe gibba]